MTGPGDEKTSYLSDFGEFEKSAVARRHRWLHGIRQSAISCFAELGFPSTREEDWKYTNVAPIAKAQFKLAGSALDGHHVMDLGDSAFPEAQCCHLTFVNGTYTEALSAIQALPRGAKVKSLAAALETERDLIEPYLARQASYNRNAFTALNTAFMADGAFLYLPRDTGFKGVVHLIFLSSGRKEATVSHPRNLFLVGDGSQASIMESYVGLEQGIYFTNVVTEMVLGRGSTLAHYKLQRESEKAFHVGTTQVLQEGNTHFSSNSIALGGALVRNNLNVVLNAEGAECFLNGLYVANGRQHVDNHTSIDHAKPHCDSRELYKGILGDKSAGVFNGRIVVRQGAQKTSAKQTNRNLLLSEEAVVNTKPQLEIFADDVKCTHAATVGRLDEDALFYMRSRGIDELSARTLLTYAFASDIIGMVEIKPIQCQLDLVLLSRLSRLQER